MHPKTLLPTYSVLVRFLEYELQPSQIQQFKTQINKIWDGQVAEFHNHIGDTEQTKIAYPFIQYRSIKTEYQNDFGHKKSFHVGGLFGVADGVALIFQLLDKIYAERKPKNLYRFEVEEYEIDIQLLEKPVRYKLNHWLPLNKVFKPKENIVVDNYEKWKEPMTMTERVGFLEGIIAGHIKDFCREIGFMIPENQLKVTLYDYKTLGKINYPNNDRTNVSLEAFDVIYEANILLPDYLGMGKGKSKGFGWQTQTEFHQLIDRNRLAQQKNNHRAKPPQHKPMN